VLHQLTNDFNCACVVSSYESGLFRGEKIHHNSYRISKSSWLYNDNLYCQLKHM